MSGVMATTIVVSALSLDYVMAAGVPAANITKGAFNLSSIDASDSTYTYKEVAGDSGVVNEIDIDFTGHGSARDKFVNYVNKNGTKADSYLKSKPFIE